jgi:hypothetical protein
MNTDEACEIYDMRFSNCEFIYGADIKVKAMPQSARCAGKQRRSATLSTLTGQVPAAGFSGSPGKSGRIRPNPTADIYDLRIAIHEPKRVRSRKIFARRTRAGVLPFLRRGVIGVNMVSHIYCL